MANRWERCGLDAGVGGALEHVCRLERMVHSRQRLMMQKREKGKSKEKGPQEGDRRWCPEHKRRS